MLHLQCLEASFTMKFYLKMIRLLVLEIMLEELKADAKLNELHRQACDWRRQRFGELMQDVENRELFARLMQTPATKPLSEAEAAGIFRMYQNAG